MALYFYLNGMEPLTGNFFLFYKDYNFVIDR